MPDCPTERGGDAAEDFGGGERGLQRGQWATCPWSSETSLLAGSSETSILSSPCSVRPQLGPGARARTQACVGRVAHSKHEQLQGGTCAGLGLQQDCTCNSFIYTHNQFGISGQNFMSCMGRYGLQRDVNSKASWKYERALYVGSSSACLQCTTVVFPSLRVSARRHLHATGSAWAAASAACGWAAVAGARRRHCPVTGATKPCSRCATKPCSHCAPSSLAGVYGARVRGCAGAVAVPVCEGTAGICALWLFSPRVLSIHVLRLEGRELAWVCMVPVGGICTGEVPEPAAPAGHWPPREHPGMLSSRLARKCGVQGARCHPASLALNFFES